MKISEITSHHLRPVKTLPLIRSVFVAAALLASLALQLQAQTWENFLPNPSVAEASGTQILVDPYSLDPSNPAVLVGPRAENGQILYLRPVDAMTYQTTSMPGSLGSVYRMEVNPVDGSAYAVGASQLVTTPPFPRNNPYVWSVQLSAFAPASQNWGAWTTADKFYLSATEAATAYGLASDNTGNVYVSGTALLKGSAHWIVRRKPASSGAWTTIADFSAKSTLTAAYGACFYPGNTAANFSPSLFVVGMISGKWTVQRLEANGSWTTVDSAPLAGWANSITCDTNGNLYVVGTRSGAVSDYGYGWVIRKSARGGAPGSWETVLDVSEGYTSAARHIAVDAAGDVWVAGYTGSTMSIKTSSNRWTVMHNIPGQSWSDSWNSRQHPFDGLSSNSGARGIDTDALGNVFITGGVTDLTDGFTSWAGPHIVVQRLVR
jgi:hypothetical protein